MDLISININNQEYTYIDKISLNNKNYVAYMDKDNVYVSEYEINNNIIFKDVDDTTFNQVIGALEL